MTLTVDLRATVQLGLVANPANPRHDDTKHSSETQSRTPLLLLPANLQRRNVWLMCVLLPYHVCRLRTESQEAGSVDSVDEEDERKQRVSCGTCAIIVSFILIGIASVSLSPTHGSHARK